MANMTTLVHALPASIVGALDPCLEFVTEWKIGRDQCNATPSDDLYEERVKPFEDVASFGTVPIATTLQGAVAALRMILQIEADEGEFGGLEPQDANLIRAALTYLEGRV